MGLECDESDIGSKDSVIRQVDRTVKNDSRLSCSALAASYLAQGKMPLRHRISGVNGHTFYGGVGIEHGFADCRVGVDGEHELVDGAFEFHDGYGFGNEFCGLGTNDVHAEDLSVFCVGDDLDEAIVAADDGGLGVAGKGKFADLDFHALLFGLRFG